jgi:hypothetical protein
LNYLAEASMVLALSLPAPAPTVDVDVDCPTVNTPVVNTPVVGVGCSSGNCYPVSYPSNYRILTPIYRRR